MRDRTILIGTIMLALAACGRSGGGGEQVVAGNVAVHATPGDITISTPNGTAQIHSGTASAAMPEGIPAYPNAQPGQTIDINGGSDHGQGRIIAFGTNDAPAQVIDFYARAVAAAGYAVENRMDMGSTVTLTARRDQGQAVNIVATQAAGSTRVQITMATNAR